MAFRHVRHEGLGLLEEVLRRRQITYNIVDLPDNAPRTFDARQLAGLVVLGGPMNVDEVERYPFLAQEVEWLREAIDERLPVLGICLGSQLLAKTLGARVYSNAVKEIGWYPIEMSDEADQDALFAGCPNSPYVFQWHGDTFDLPKHATRLASSRLCRNQAFRFGNAIYGLQFHIEVTAEIIADWLAEPGNCGELAGLDYIDPNAVLKSTPERLPAMTELGRTVLGRWADLCKARRTAR